MTNSSDTGTASPDLLARVGHRQDPHAFANDYAYRVLKLRSEIMQGKVDTKLEVRPPGDKEGCIDLNLNPRSIFKMDKTKLKSCAYLRTTCAATP
jgi:hypothetical protein